MHNWASPQWWLGAVWHAHLVMCTSCMLMHTPMHIFSCALWGSILILFFIIYVINMLSKKKNSYHKHYIYLYIIFMLYNSNRPPQNYYKPCNFSFYFAKQKPMPCILNMLIYWIFFYYFFSDYGILVDEFQKDMH